MDGVGLTLMLFKYGSYIYSNPPKKVRKTTLLVILSGCVFLKGQFRKWLLDAFVENIKLIPGSDHAGTGIWVQITNEHVSMFT